MCFVGLLCSQGSVIYTSTAPGATAGAIKTLEPAGCAVALQDKLCAFESGDIVNKIRSLL